jgi:hypothetical protein
MHAAGDGGNVKALYKLELPTVQTMDTNYEETLKFFKYEGPCAPSLYISLYTGCRKNIGWTGRQASSSVSMHHHLAVRRLKMLRANAR